MRLEPLPALQDNYIWLLADDNGHALVVDPGEAEPVERALTRQHVKLTTILLTHHHADHVGAAAMLRERHGASVYAPVDGRIDDVDHRVGEGDQVTLNAPAAHFEVWAVPGHTRSHIAYIGEGLAFSGDTLFSLGCGRLFEGTPQQMLDALDRFAMLPDDTLVCCGHEYTLANARFAHTIEPDNDALAMRTESARQAVADGRASLPARMGEERAANPFLRTDCAAIRQWAGNRGVAPDDRTGRFAALRATKDGFKA
ncbi:MAG TPA: hydroxyacylglutathione hydrolase [Rhodanobacteraceae bacterium]